jgi:hypothetical protein
LVDLEPGAFWLERGLTAFMGRRVRLSTELASGGISPVCDGRGLTGSNGERQRRLDGSVGAYAKHEQAENQEGLPNSGLDPTSILVGSLRYAAFVPFGRGSGRVYLIGWGELEGLAAQTQAVRLRAKGLVEGVRASE